jgi:hypothetical protein
MRRSATFVVLLWVFSAVPAFAVQYIIRGEDGWTNTGIRVVRGMRLSVTARGAINVGPAGSFESEGTVGAVPRPDLPFPAATPAYSLAIRLTSNDYHWDDLRRDFTPGQMRDYCSQTDGYLFLRANDNQPEDNAGHFVVDIEVSSCGAAIAPRPDVTIVRVRRGGIVPAAGADLVIDGRSVRRTDFRGEAILPPLPAGTRIVARELITEVPTTRANHETGSTANWRYRVYRTSAEVKDDGSLAVYTVLNPPAIQELTIRTDNTLIGLHLTASLEWDGSPADLSALSTHLRDTSTVLYNATDGQFFIEQAEIIDNGQQWSDVDYRVYGNQSMRASANFAGYFGGGFMHMNRFNWWFTYAHEFGHYGLALGDEYQDDTPVTCTRTVADPMSAFTSTNPRASCLMWNNAPKFCSMHPSNPHVTTTRQGPQDCFSAIIARYRDTQDPPRWILRSPASRSRIPGRLPDIAAAWQTRVTSRNIRDGVLCPPTRFVPVAPGTTTPLNDVDIFLRTREGRTILLGHPKDNPRTPRNEAEDGVLVVGASPGDRLIAGSTTTIVEPCAMDVSASMPGAAAQIASLAPVPLAQTAAAPNAETRLIAVRAEAAAVLVEPRGKDGLAVVLRFLLPVESARAAFTETGSTKSIAIELEGDGDIRRGTLPTLGPDVIGDIAWEATAADGTLLEGVERVRITNATAEDDVRSDDGQVSLTLAKDDLPNQLAIIRVAPAGPEHLVSGPYAIAAYRPLRGRATLRFQLPDLIENRDGWSGAAPFDPDSFAVVRLEAGRWTPLATVAHPDVAVFVAYTGAPGTYALTARPKSAPGLAATLTADPAAAGGGKCPATITFNGTITSDRAGEVSYTFVRSDGARGPVQTLSFSGPGTQQVSTTWTLGEQYSGWQAIQILKPVEVQSNQAAFTLSCQ